jgi:MFS family permease
MLLGPLVGGLLSSGNGNGVLKAFPYAPPNIFAAAIYTIAAISVFLGLEETLEHFKHHEGSIIQRLWKKLTARSHTPSHGYTVIDSSEPNSPESTVTLVNFPEPSSDSNSGASKPKARLPFRRIWTWNVLCTMLAHFIIAGHIATFTNLWAIFLSTPLSNPKTQHAPFQFSGGLSMQPREVGFAMSTLGAIGVTLQLVIYPMLNDKFGTIRIWRAALFVFPVAYTLAPFPALIASLAITSVSGKAVIVWISVGFVLLLFVVGRTGVTPATTLLINDCTPHPSVRGTIHTAGTVIGNLSRSFFPVIAFAIFGKGLEVGVVGLGFWCLACLGILACVASRWVEQGSNGREIVLEGEEPVQEQETSGNVGQKNGGK